jgi:hypothetical protein
MAYLLKVDNMEKTYIGKVEAFEVMLERNIDRLPRKGKEIITVYSIAEKLAKGLSKDPILGKDEQGYYLAEI